MTNAAAYFHMERDARQNELNRDAPAAIRFGSWEAVEAELKIVRENLVAAKDYLEEAETEKRAVNSRIHELESEKAALTAQAEEGVRVDPTHVGRLVAELAALAIQLQLEHKVIAARESMVEELRDQLFVLAKDVVRVHIRVAVSEGRERRKQRQAAEVLEEKSIDEAMDARRVYAGMRTHLDAEQQLSRYFPQNKK